MTKTRKYDAALFEEIVKRDGFTPQPRPSAFYASVNICGLCACGEPFEKTFISVVIRGGARCRRCVKVNAMKKAAVTNMKKYGCAHPMHNATVLRKFETTNLERYGSATPLGNAAVRQKIENTNIERFGCANPLQNADTRQKATLTNWERYGCAYPMQNRDVMQRRICTNTERYGCSHPLLNAAVQQKASLTIWERYGCAHVLQNPEIAERASKNAYKSKEYTFPCGEVRTVQGYESFALDDLVRQGYRAEDIVTARNQVPEVWWTAADGGRHRYFVDIFLPAENRMIEVKSAYTAAKEGVTEKAQACLDAGFAFELWVYDPNGQRV